MNRYTITEDSPQTILLAIKDRSGFVEPTITVYVYNVTTATAVTPVYNVTTYETVQDESDDERFTPTNSMPGYNAEIALSGSNFNTGGTVVQVEVSIEPADGEPQVERFEFTVDGVYGS